MATMHKQPDTETRANLLKVARQNGQNVYTVEEAYTGITWWALGYTREEVEWEALRHKIAINGANVVGEYGKGRIWEYETHACNLASQGATS